MDAYEATRVVFSRIQSLDPDNAARVMGLLLIKDHGEKEMIRLAFVAEPILRSIVLAARKELGLPQQASSPVSAVAPPFLLGCHNSTRLGSSLPSPTSWAPPPVFSSNSGVVNGCGGGGGAMDDFECSEELLSPSNTATASSPLYGANGGNDVIHEFHLQDQLSFLNEGGGASNSGAHGLHMISKNAGELFYQDIPAECRSPSGQGAGMFPSSIAGWPPAAASGAFHRRSCSAAADLYGGAAAGAGADPGFGWKPCLYFARGYCKNGSSCRFLHGIPDDTAVGGNIDAADAGLQQQCQEFLRRSKSPRQLLASAFPFSPTGPLPELPPGGNKFMNFMLQHQNENQRTSAAAAVAAARFLLGGVEDSHTSIGRGARMMERSDFAAGMGSPSSRQIYLTFPADSTFREEDVSNYFSIYGPVQDVRIPYQQKRMFGFVTFLYPETVKLILAKGNPHFVCDARVLVKPYKEKGKVAEKKQQQYPLVDRGEFYGSSALSGLDSGDSFQFPQLGARMLYHEALLNRRLEEQQQAEELQRAIELQSKRFIGLQLTDTKTRSQFNSNVDAFSSPAITLAVATAEQENSNVNEDKGSSPPRIAETTPAAAAAAAAATVAKVESPKEDISIQESSVEHNLPDNPFASPTKADSSSLMGDSYSSSMLPTEDTFVSAVLDRGSGNSNRFIESSLSPVASPLRHCLLQPMLLPNS